MPAGLEASLNHGERGDHGGNTLHPHLHPEECDYEVEPFESVAQSHFNERVSPCPPRSLWFKIGSLLPAIRTPRRRRFVDHDLRQAREIGCEFLPEPVGHILNRRVLQTGNLIEIAVIKLIYDRLHKLADTRMVVEPAGRLVDFAFDRDLHFEAVPMHLPALMTLRGARKGLRGFEHEVFGQSNFHRKRRLAQKLHSGLWIFLSDPRFPLPVFTEG